MREQFREINLRAATLAKIEKANEIIAEYQREGYKLTLRQLYYQFVARDLIPNTFREYKNLGDNINDGRVAGLIDWDAIFDETRSPQRNSIWEDGGEFCQAAQYQIERWEGQEFLPEIWIEKDALKGVISPVAKRWQVPYFSCRGNSSQSAIYEAGKRIAARYENDGLKTFIIHLGDHDPSGIDMTRDNRERLELFSGLTEGDGFVFNRIALNMDQVRKYRPPPNPVKNTDSRSGGYRAQFGEKCWELDALRPQVIVGLIQKMIEEIVDQDQYDARVEREDQERGDIQEAADNWPDIVRFVRSRESVIELMDENGIPD